MSTIVAVRNETSAVIAADCQSYQGNVTTPGDMRAGPGKIHRVGEAYIGIVGGLAHQNVLRSTIASNPGLFDFADTDTVFESLRKLHPILREQYYLLTQLQDDRDQEYESSQISGLIISRGGVFSFGGQRGVIEFKTFWAAGSGMDFALGALHVAYPTAQHQVRMVAENAVKAACEFDWASGLPIESYEVTLRT